LMIPSSWKAKDNCSKPLSKHEISLTALENMPSARTKASLCVSGNRASRRKVEMLSVLEIVALDQHQTQFFGLTRKALRMHTE
jgi:hypothetical protein